MAGLNCGFPSLGAFDVLRRGVDALIAIPDHYAEDGRCDDLPRGGPAVVAGESGAASVAGLIALMRMIDTAAFANTSVWGRDAGSWPGPPKVLPIQPDGIGLWDGRFRRYPERRSERCADFAGRPEGPNDVAIEREQQ